MTKTKTQKASEDAANAEAAYRASPEFAAVMFVYDIAMRHTFNYDDPAAEKFEILCHVLHKCFPNVCDEWKDKSFLLARDGIEAQRGLNDIWPGDKL